MHKRLRTSLLPILGLATAFNLVACSGAEEESSPETTSDAATSESMTVSSGASPSAAPSTTPTPPPLNEGPAPALTGTFEMDGPATITGATYDSMPFVVPLNPAGPQDTMVRWVDGWGQSPATAEQGTTYVLGHAWGQQKLVFNPFSEVVTANVDLNNPTIVEGLDGMDVQRFSTPVLNGSHIRMTSDDGVGREWIVDNAFLVDKEALGSDADLMNTEAPGRIVLIACAVDGSTDLEYNVIVTGHLA
ncbi:sortase [Corynebacterium aurimucosum]|uniref:sortase n=1 Tax=Corynebacterium aurimucosum TaxID=169292 RepID=UPI001C0EF6D6|nr:sortase [Corynebacterium aurimucosum]MBU5654993.1 sortase [Corynebacterium aurimucosum]